MIKVFSLFDEIELSKWVQKIHSIKSIYKKSTLCIKLLLQTITICFRLHLWLSIVFQPPMSKTWGCDVAIARSINLFKKKFHKFEKKNKSERATWYLFYFALHVCGSLARHLFGQSQLLNITTYICKHFHRHVFTLCVFSCMKYCFCRH